MPAPLPPNTPALYHSPYVADSDLGPAMRALNPRQQAIVAYLLDTGQVDKDAWTEAAIAVGYSPSGNRQAAAQTAHNLRHSPKVTAAIQEEARRRVGNDLPMFLKTIRTIAGDPSHKDALKAATTGAAMAGVSAISLSKTETHVTHHLDPFDEIERNLALLPPERAAVLRKMLLPPTIDVTPTRDIDRPRRSGRLKGSCDRDRRIADYRARITRQTMSELRGRPGRARW